MLKNGKISVICLLIVVAFCTLLVTEGRPKGKKSKRKSGSESTSSQSSSEDLSRFISRKRRPKAGKSKRRSGSRESRSSESSSEDSSRDVSTVSDCPTAPTTPPKKAPWDRRPPTFELKPQDKDALRRGCKKKRGGCKSQSQGNRNRRNEIKNFYKQTRKGRGKGNQKGKNRNRQEETATVESTTTVEEDEGAEALAESYLGKVQNAKLDLLKTQGLDSEIEPNDDGLWQGDIMLTDAQLDRMLANQNQGNDTTSGARKKRYALFLETKPAEKWDKLPIKFTFDPTFDSGQKETIRSALKDIEFKTCIKFAEVSDEPENEQHIMFRKITGPSFCGFSNLGRTGSQNLVWINFGCATVHGTATHEVLHALGIDHHQTRYDRDDHLQINWDTIDPQSLDLFAQNNVSDYTSYGVPYDYFSVMHYNAYVRTTDINKPSMTPKKKPDFYLSVLGQRVAMSDKDAELVRKMYCSPDCEDSNVFCGWWATDGYCENEAYIASMARTCKKSCGMCPGGNEISTSPDTRPS